VTTMLAVVLGIAGGLAMTALGDMVSEEVRDRLDHLPQAVLRLAGRRVDPAKRKATYNDEWLPELTYILKGEESRPVTRLFVGTRYALGILISARRIARHLSRPAPGQLACTPGEGRDVSATPAGARAADPIAELFDRLDGLHSKAGRPSMREIAIRAGRGNISSSNAHNVFRRSRVPRWAFLEQVIGALDGAQEREAFITLWQAAWVAENHVPAAPESPVGSPGR
jgi:hypothetical protein